ncbi:MAG TPA: response regulator transcription factor [Lachnospiraceae bacterium]|nr:response regulator transcription factor [Lachnospiraceae bacterium]
MKKIGVLEDDTTLSSELKYYLETNGYEVRLIRVEEYAEKGEEFLITLLMDSGCQLILLDIGLPGIDGLHLCKEFCRKAEIPVIMITSRDTELTELLSISNGADDFVAKPFRPQILLARMEAVMKRVYKDTKQTDVLQVVCAAEQGDFSFSVELLKGRVAIGNASVELTKNELQMLKLLAQNQGEIVTRDDLMNGLWDNCMFVDDNTLTVNMTRLKAKLEGIGIKGAIVTKRGMGYQLL